MFHSCTRSLLTTVSYADVEYLYKSSSLVNLDLYTTAVALYFCTNSLETQSTARITLLILESSLDQMWLGIGQI